MKIYSMTATFGKLEHETLTLKPGLNIIEAPNEWGKSTWCAFLVTMLYGLDTRAKTTKASLADKERFAPWSGSPMSGRIDLNWNGRDITIERSSKGRTPMGVFRAFETVSGIEIPELTGSNCGQMLLGVERSVFTRSAFLRFADLPVTQDDALRHRLNALVTTGDESGAAEALGQKLRDLKNHCRYNKSGLLPQAESQRAELESKLREIDELNTQSQRLHQRHGQVEQWIAQLENHRTGLTYAAAQADSQRIRAAEAAYQVATENFRQLEATCAELPDRRTAEVAMERLNALRQNQDALQMEEQMLPDAPVQPEAPPMFRGMTPREAVEQAAQDSAVMTALTEPKKTATPMLVAAALLAAVGIVLLFLKLFVLGLPALAAAVALLIAGVVAERKHKQKCVAVRQKRSQLCDRYGTDDVREWMAAATAYQTVCQEYQQKLEDYNAKRSDLEERKKSLFRQGQSLSEGRTLADWQSVLAALDALDDARRSQQQARYHWETLQAMAKPVQAPAEPDHLTYTEAETNRLLSDAAYELRQLHQKLGQCSGQMEALGSVDGLNRELEAVQRRIYSLEQTYAALERALSALTAARQELQRRFAPRITQRAHELFARLTGDRYDRLVLSEDLSVQAGARGEDVLRSQQWRSDGTVDQLYLALRLAVAQELIPDSPLILDDALVRFDDTRLATAMEILKQEAQDKQVILFTCQKREKALLER